MPFRLQDIVERVGGAEAFQRVLGLAVQIVKRTDRAIAARVGSPLDLAKAFEVMVSHELAGRCPCPAGAQGSFCDHLGAAALEWLLVDDALGRARFDADTKPRFQ